MNTIHLIRGNGQVVYYDARIFEDSTPYLGSWWWWLYCNRGGRDET